MKIVYAGLIAALICGFAGYGRSPAAASEIPAAQATAPEALLEKLYSHYGGDKADEFFSPMGKQAPQWFDTEMVALMAEDARLANGEVGALDGDPVCGCQDYGRLSADIKIVEVAAAAAKAVVVVTETDASFDAEARKPRTFTYDLVRESAGWRIHDIGTPDIPSLHDWLARSNAKAGSR